MINREGFREHQAPLEEPPASTPSLYSVDTCLALAFSSVHPVCNSLSEKQMVERVWSGYLM